jgi:hypothetical protein
MLLPPHYKNGQKESFCPVSVLVIIQRHRWQTLLEKLGKRFRFIRAVNPENLFQVLRIDRILRTEKSGLPRLHTDDKRLTVKLVGEDDPEVVSGTFRGKTEEPYLGSLRNVVQVVEPFHQQSLLMAIGVRKQN